MEIIKGDKTIHSEWKDYYLFLESLRQSGKINMWGASVVLEDVFDLSKSEASTILTNWMHNYAELSTMYNWR